MLNAQELPNWSGVKLELWNYNNSFFPSEWEEPKLGGYDWKAGNVRIVDDELNLYVSEQASGQIQANDAAFREKARWEVEVTVPKMEPGLIAAPLWTYNKDTLSEIDFEIVGLNGLQLTLWAKVNGAHTTVWSKKYVISGDLSGRRGRLAIEYESGNLVIFYVDGWEVARVTPEDTNGGFPQGPQKPYFDLWAANGLNPGWAGAWAPLSAGHARRMILHGYCQS